ncbi:MAG: PBP superfamily domain protein [Candidatus Accumulibacter cognatus]|uniref:PBP superfamily domain protein n=2 Tax=Candidatus Accumulibacter cognatus TaxID=2954383 RepID=A0A080M808_9PROT|nr:MAG: PBP superfamily domain protein [Candidatus Accumulibacter cognatus]
MARAAFFRCGHLATAMVLLLAFFSTHLAARDLRLATTTSTDNSGLLRAILPQFEWQQGIRVQIISVGTGKALKLAENGDVDVVLVHDRQAEEAFVAAGYGVNRRDVMYNDFVIVGPASDPATLRGGREVLEAFRQIAARQARFVSRGDDSGTERMERSYWQQLGIATKGAPWYVSAGLGMGEVLTMAGEMQAYTLTDRATFASYKTRTGLAILVQGDPRLFNPYGVIAVNPKRYPEIHFAGAMALIEWLSSAAGHSAISAFRPNGEQLFFVTPAR